VKLVECQVECPAVVSLVQVAQADSQVLVVRAEPAMTTVQLLRRLTRFFFFPVTGFLTVVSSHLGRH